MAHFELSDSDPLTSNFTDRQGNVIYACNTPSTWFKRAATTISSHSRQFAAIQWVTWGHSRSTIHYRGQAFVASQFFKDKSFLRMKRRFTGDDGRRYTWEARSSGCRLYDPSDNIIAEYHQPTAHLFSRDEPGYLDVTPQAIHMLDLIIVTLVYFDKVRTDDEKSAEAGAEVASAAAG